jgi:hypothetical protein
MLEFRQVNCQNLNDKYLEFRQVSRIIEILFL